LNHVFPPSNQIAESFRVGWNWPAKMYDCDGRFVCACIVSNFSNGGAKTTEIEIDDVADEFMLRMTPQSRLRRCRVVWRSKDGIGAAFADNPDNAGEIAGGHRQRRLAQA
jgi:hypothetical protein